VLLQLALEQDDLLGEHVCALLRVAGGRLGSSQFIVGVTLVRFVRAFRLAQCVDLRALLGELRLQTGDLRVQLRLRLLAEFALGGKAGVGLPMGEGEQRVAQVCSSGRVE